MHNARRRKSNKLVGRKRNGRQLLNDAPIFSSVLDFHANLHQNPMHALHLGNEVQRIKIESMTDAVVHIVISWIFVIKEFHGYSLSH